MFLLLCVFGQICLGQSLSSSDREILAYAAKSISSAKSVSIIYEEKKKDQPAVITELADKEWELRFAEVLKQSDVKRNSMHVFGFNYPMLVVSEAKLAIDFPNQGMFQIEVSRDGEPPKQLDLVLDDPHWDLLLQMIMKKRANQHLRATAQEKSGGEEGVSQR